MIDPKKRIALIIGNSEYEFATQLRNPSRDADSITNVVKKLGFDVVTKKNLSLKDFKKTIQEFGFRIKDYETVLFFFAGHGMQVNGTNYLIPTDANPNGENQVDFESINANWILSLIEDGKAQVNIIVLDACRNNPFKRSWNRAPSHEGLSFQSAPKGTLIAYSTAPDRTALDGEGENSPYTKALVDEIINPAISINQLFQAVRSKVIKMTNGRQVPWESTSLLDDFFFNNGHYISIETFCYGLLYNNANDRVFNNLLLDINSFRSITKSGLQINKEDVQKGVIEVFAKNGLKIFEIFEGVEYKLYENGIREYIFFVNNFRDANAIFQIARSIYMKLGVGLYDDRRKKSFFELDPIKKIANKKTRNDQDECFSMWSFDRVTFFLLYLIEPSCQFSFQVKYTPERKVIQKNILSLLKLNVPAILDCSNEIHREHQNGIVHHVDYFLQLEQPELKVFNSITLRIFNDLKTFDFTTETNIFLTSKKVPIKVSDVAEIAGTLTAIYGADRSGNGYLEGWEVDGLKRKEYWSGRMWDFNLQHQLWDSDCNSEMPLYSIYFSYDDEKDELELSILGYNRLIEFFNQTKH